MAGRKRTGFFLGKNGAVDEIPLRDRLVLAGVELLEEEGLAALSLRAITRRTGVSHGAPRRYFPTHNSLLAAIAATGLADLAGRLTAPADGAARDQLVELGRRYLAFAAERPAMFELIFRHDLLEGAGGNLRTTTLPLLESLTRIVATVAPADAAERTVGLWTSLHGLAVLRATKTLDLVLGTTQLDTFVTRAVDAHLS
ncbi:TetR/AcrR family transcriptional regulator [Kribbella italica]|uniref:AcrR family transcriptional regulator n=1 Tax=Kribbella italica TaxID=1540520 RepID=A0A7W9JCL7_9ACTN|nr:TetR/AcrR family transcriptional regulator [Kribbella italica]MBB5839691.1 AcrR family transcriptional regulator [Kribbella italica]